MTMVISQKIRQKLAREAYVAYCCQLDSHLQAAANHQYYTGVYSTLSRVNQEAWQQFVVAIVDTGSASEAWAQYRAALPKESSSLVSCVPEYSGLSEQAAKAVNAAALHVIAWRTREYQAGDEVVPTMSTATHRKIPRRI